MADAVDTTTPKFKTPEPDWKTLPTQYPFHYSTEPLKGDILLPLADSDTPFNIPAHLAPYFELITECEPDDFPFTFDILEPISLESIHTLLTLIDFIHSHPPLTITIPRPINTDNAHYTLNNYGIPTFLQNILTSIPLTKFAELIQLSNYLRAPQLTQILFVYIAHYYRSMHYLTRMNTLVPSHKLLDSSRTDSNFETLIHSLPQSLKRQWILYL
jgi:hypothetical protein